MDFNTSFPAIPFVFWGSRFKIPFSSLRAIPTEKNELGWNGSISNFFCKNRFCFLRSVSAVYSIFFVTKKKRLDVLSLTDSPADAQTKGPLTGKDLEEAGEFTIAVPKGSSVSLTALCDDNKDGKITEKDDKLSSGARIGSISEDKDNVELVLEAIQPPTGGPDGGSGGPGAGGPGSDAPNSGGPGAGGPGAGGPGAGGPGAGGTDETQKDAPEGAPAKKDQ